MSISVLSRLASQRSGAIAARLLAVSLLLGAVPASAQSPSGRLDGQRAAAARPFEPAGVGREAERYEKYLKDNWKVEGQPARQLAEGNRLLAAGSDPRAAARAFAHAVVGEPQLVDAWIGLAQALLAIKPDPQKGAERYELPANATGAALIAHRRATTPTQRARALVVLSAGLQRRSQWRPAIDALAESLKLVEAPAVREAYTRLRNTHGFRILDHKVDAEARQPRICVQFSERPEGGAAELAKFVTLGGREPQALVVEEKQLCVDGLKHGERYELKVRQGLPSRIGETLLQTAEIAVYVRDRSPLVRATGRNYVLPTRGQQGIPLVTLNTDKVSVEVFRIGDRGLLGSVQGDGFPRQLESWDVAQIEERSGQRVYKGELAVARRLNEEVTTAFPVSEALPRLEPGVYLLSAAIAGPRGSGGNGDSGRPPARATQWFIVSDLGLTAFTGSDGLHAFVRSLASADAQGDVEVRLVARNNEVLGTARTDAKGYARFAPGLARGKGGLAPALLIAQVEGRDYAFLDLAGAAFDLTDRGVKGREAPGPVDGYLYTDRGVYRPGESVHLVALVRDAAAVASAVPTTLVISRPDGVEHARTVLTDRALGGRAHTLALGRASMTGTWRAKLHTDPAADPIAQVAFLVEDFVPERLDLTLTPKEQALVAGTSGSLEVAGKYLYGPPAADMALEAEVVVKAAASAPGEGLAGYRFGDTRETVTTVRRALEALPRTGADGRATLAVHLPALPDTVQPLAADLIVRLREASGRTIERRTTLPVDVRKARIGVKPGFAAGGLGEGDLASFDVVSLAADGARRSEAALTWQVLRLERTWQWYNRDGYWSFDAVTSTRKVLDGTVATSRSEVGRIAAQLPAGRYRLEVRPAAADEAMTVVLFDVGWSGGDGLETPEALDVMLDKASYKAGETARLKINSRQPGKALIAIVGSGVHAVREVDIPAGGGEVTIPVDAAWMPGAYVTAMLYRPLDQAARRMPARALGVRWLALDASERTLGVDLATPERVRSGGRLAVPVTLSGLPAGEEAHVTVAAVDVGVLNLTRFASPKPQAWFHAQRRLGAEVRDLYGRLIDGMRAERGQLRSGGDGDGGMSLQGSPRAERTLALHSGIVRVGPDGKTTVDFEMPDFNGAVRLMAVAWSKGKVGSAEREVIVRDPVAVTATAPRFLALGDRATLALELHNVEGRAGNWRLGVEREAGRVGQSLKSREVALAEGARVLERVALVPNELGLHAYTVRLAGPDGTEIVRRITLDVKPPAGDIRRTSKVALAPRSGRLTLGADLLADLIPSHTRATVSVGPLAALDVPGLVGALDRYPYGCAEQTVSRALPLLYLEQVAARVGIAGEAEAKARVAGAIARVLEMQDGTGAFGTWGPSNTNLWLTSFVADFLTRAKERGHVVPALAMGQALDRLQSSVSYGQDFQKGGEERAYALYVLARNGRAPIGELRYDVDTRLARFATPLAQAQLGAALALLGDRVRAEKAFAAAIARIDGADADEAREDYGTGLRDGAGIVTLAAEAKIATAELPRLSTVIARAQAAKTWTSTQEQAWLLLAAHALGEQGAGLMLDIAGRTHRGEAQLSPTVDEIRRGLTITNRSEQAVDAVVTVVGASRSAEPAIAKGFGIERTYYKLDGTPVDLASAAGGSARLAQNERLVVVLEIKSDKAGGRILLVDRLPAGLEIENPRLLESGSTGNLAWLTTENPPEHAEFRDDRFVAAFDLFGRDGRRGGDARESASGARVAYMVRAVSPGSFVHPAATVEDMYRPDRHARTAAGRLEVVAEE
jgi:uncharacterized protein YfaS (alpha-2-macroglobulin family)